MTYFRCTPSKWRWPHYCRHGIRPCTYQTGLGGRWLLGDTIFQDALAYSWLLAGGRFLADGRHLADSREDTTWVLLLGLKNLLSPTRATLCLIMLVYGREPASDC
jgi:hypothetical protein